MIRTTHRPGGGARAGAGEAVRGAVGGGGAEAELVAVADVAGVVRRMTSQR